MGWSFTFMRVRGIELKVHVTFVLILVWAALYWSAVADEGGRGALFGIVATLLLFVCVLLHELGHSLTAARCGIHVEDITLLPIGGVARIEIPENPKQEFWITVAGPAVNVVIAILLIGLGAILDQTSVLSLDNLADSMRSAEWSGLLPYLTVANILLVIFNILPAFPMDGGRILRSLLAMRMSYRRATRIAVSVGQGMAMLFGLFGFLTGNFFLIIIAIFIWFGAGAEGTQVEVKGVLGRLTAGEAMIRDPQTLEMSDPLSRAVELTLTTSQADFPVIDRTGQLSGLLTAEDLLAALRDGRTELVGVLMRRDVPPISPTMPLSDVQTRLANQNVRALPVADADGQLLGLLTFSDINEAFRLLSIEPNLRRTPAGARPV
jgi:Zn-dependent protease/CBS domain-containing protein